MPNRFVQRAGIAPAVGTSRCMDRIEAQRCGFDSERKKKQAFMQLSRLLLKPRKRNRAGFF